MATFSTFTKTSSGSSVDNRSKARSMVPDSIVSEDSSKRNILRKGKNGGPKGKFKNNVTDDGSAVLAGPRPTVDQGDPLFDVEEDENYILVSGQGEGGGIVGSPKRRNYDPEYRRMVVGPKLTLAEFKRRVTTSLEEYFSSEDIQEFMTIINEIECPEYHYEIVKKSISLSLDRAERERELVSKLLSECYGCDLLPTNSLGKGFERLFESADDLEIDVPGAGHNISVFLARALVDEILPPSFLTDPVVASMGGEIVAEAIRMLSRDHQYSRLERIWGPGDGRPVEELKQSIDILLNEYLISYDYEEAGRCVRELRVAHFHHEVLKRAIVLVLDKDEIQQEMMGKLFKHLFSMEIISITQIQLGLNKIYKNLKDLVLDAPFSSKVLDYFVKYFITEQMIDPGFKLTE